MTIPPAGDFCECGHRFKVHLFSQPPSTFVPGLPDPIRFERCDGLHGECPCRTPVVFQTGLYRHAKRRTVYLATALGHNSEDKTIIEVEYTDIADGTRWHRPLRGHNCGFLDTIEVDGVLVPRFELLDEEWQ